MWSDLECLERRFKLNVILSFHHQEILSQLKSDHNTGGGLCSPTAFLNWRLNQSLSKPWGIIWSASSNICRITFSPKHQGAVLSYSKLGVLHPAAVPHQPPAAHHVSQTLSWLGVEEAAVLGIKAPGGGSCLLDRRPAVRSAATEPSWLQHRHRP